MLRLYVPEIGDCFELTQDWHFTLYDEYRNSSLWDLLGCESILDRARANKELDEIKDELNEFNAAIYRGQPIQDPADETRYQELLKLLHDKFHHSVPASLPAGSRLKLDRVYIRRGAKEFSSLSFFLTAHPEFQFKKAVRFWAKLSDCNQIEFSLIGGK